MTNSPDRCQQLRKLHAQLTAQIQLLKENIQKEEREGVDTSVEALNTLKRLQSSLSKITLELEQCPPGKEEVAASASTSAPASWLVRSWYPDSTDSDDNEPELVLDDN
ncbi:MAG: hypothetical protein JO011_02770 [Ktedonobacteraceae bacterium]|nr:hypothetical protein [Ktedonobacteraceae bacterium]